jgi:hypothetical protein
MLLVSEMRFLDGIILTIFHSLYIFGISKFNLRFSNCSDEFLSPATNLSLFYIEVH